MLIHLVVSNNFIQDATVVLLQVMTKKKLFEIFMFKIEYSDQ